MKNLKRITIVLAILFISSLQCQPLNNDETSSEIKAAYNLLDRVIPGYSKDFQLKISGSSAANDEFELEASGGKVNITGNSAIALTKGIYYYLKNAADCMITWNGSHIVLPTTLPDCPLTKISTPYEYRLYYNVCTYGYTTAFWDWNQWQKEIDWMALHGINMPVAMIGQEAIWQKVWKSMGISDEDLANYFSGPAFLPWHRMGNINKHGGPLPQSYIDKSVELQKKILSRMRELGMNPVVPAFSGYAPSSLKKIYPDADIITMKPWDGFPSDNGTFMLSPLSKYFNVIGKKFIEEYRKEYGQCHFYLADAFNEMTVPVSQENRYKELSDFGSAIFNSINSGDSSGVWVMQGWLFFSDSGFWDRPSVQALLKNVPDKRMIIIDLAEESFNGWKKFDGFFGKKWIYSVIHNYGGHNQLFGDLPFDANDPSKMLESNARGDMVGFGISPEGVENNEVVYELLTDVEWTDRPIDLDKWIESYCDSRYGKHPDNVTSAWKYLLKACYSQQNAFPHNLFQYRPAAGLRSDIIATPDLEKAADLFLSASEEMKNNSLYTADGIQISVQVASAYADSLISEALAFNKSGDSSKRDEAFGKAFSIINKIDGLLSAHPLYKLNRWIDFARGWADNDKEAEFYEENAKRQITTWGGPYLSEYASKLWSGLVKDYYLPRWEKFADSLKTGAKCDLYDWEEKWITTPVKHYDENTPANPLQFAKELISEGKKDLTELSGK